MELRNISFIVSLLFSLTICENLQEWSLTTGWRKFKGNKGKPYEELNFISNRNTLSVHDMPDSSVFVVGSTASAA